MRWWRRRGDKRDAALAGGEIGADFKQRGGVPSEVRGTVPFYGLYESEPNYAALAQPAERRAAFKPSNGMLGRLHGQASPPRDQRETSCPSWCTRRTEQEDLLRGAARHCGVLARRHLRRAHRGERAWGRGASVAVDCEKNEINGLRPSVIHFSSHVEPPPGEITQRHLVVTADPRRRGTVECYRQDAPLDLPDDGLPRWRHTFSLER